jgi:hypothetical protein
MSITQTMVAQIQKPLRVGQQGEYVPPIDREAAFLLT